MKKASLILLLILVINKAFAQTEIVAPKTKELQQLYLGFGAGLTKTNASDLEKLGNVFFSNLNLSFSNNTFFRGGFNYTRFNENLNQYPDLKSKGYLSPTHEITSFYLSIGKRKQLGNFFLIQATAGISYNRHTQPENIRSYPHYGPTFFGTSNILDFEKVTKHKLGFIIQAEIIGGRRLNWSGLSLGSFYHYIPNAMHGGLTLALNLGLLSRE